MVISDVCRQLLDVMDTGLLVEDADRKVILVNETFCQIFNQPYPADWILGKNHLDYLERNSLRTPAMRGFYEQALELSTRPEPTTCKNIELKVGRLVVLFSYTPLFEDGKPKAHVWQFRDITEKSMLRSELRSQSDFYETVLDNAPVDITVLDQDFRFRYVNKHAIKDNALREMALGMTEGEYAEARGQGRAFGERRTQYFRQAAVQRQSISYLEQMEVGGTVRNIFRRVIAYFDHDSPLPQYYVGFGLDVTDLTETREKLELLNAVQANTLQSLPIWPYSIEFRDGSAPRLLFVRDEMLSFISGASKNKMIQPMRWFRGIHPEDRAIVRMAISLIKSGEKMQGAIDFRWYLKDFGYIWLRNYYKAVPQPDGSLMLYGLVNDESRLKARDRKLARTESDFRIMLDNLDVEVCAFGSDLRLMAANSNFNQIHQLLYNKPAEIGKHIYDEKEPIFADEEWKARVEQVLRGEPVDRNVVRNYAGRSYYFKCELRPIFFEGEVIGATFVRYDITDVRNYASELEQLLDKLRVTESLFQQISSNTSDLICLHNLDGRIAYVSPSSTFFIGVSPEHLIGIDPYQMVHPDFQEQVKRSHQKIVRGETTGGTGQIQIQLVRVDGTSLWVEIQFTLVTNAKGEPESILTVSRDIMHHKRIEEEMKMALMKERELNEMKSRFVNTISHEFRTPLATMLTSVDLLELVSDYIETPRTKDKVLRHSGIIREEILRINELMNEVLLLGRQQANTIVFRPEQVEVVSLCKEVIAKTFRHKKLQVRLDFNSPVTELPWRLDRTLMTHVIRNLLSNAVKYGGGADKNILFELAVKDKSLILSITDFGIGIPPEEIDRLFEPFFRASNTGTISGTGIGLSLIRQFVKMHGGEVSVRSRLNESTTFTVTLPVLSHESYPVD